MVEYYLRHCEKAVNFKAMKPQIARYDVGTAAEKSGRDPGEKKLFVSRTTGYVKVSAEQITNSSRGGLWL